MTAAPNVLLGPLAGALVDRWDRRVTMIVCDVLRAGLVLLVPVVVNGSSMWMVYAVAFAVATVGLLFRPAKNAVVPAIVNEDQLVTANSASSINETVADLIGYPIAAAIVATLAGIIGAAFVLDAGTYLVSALLIYGMTVPAQDLVRVPFSVRAIWHEMGEGWSYLTRQAELFWNTVISTVAQLAFGAEIVCSFIYAREVLDQSRPGLPGELRLDDERAGTGVRDRRTGDRRVRDARAQGTDDDQRLRPPGRGHGRWPGWSRIRTWRLACSS